ncbi:MAG: glycerol-3-phosphate 1-O-acyltransferase PlsY [Actinobacteria bacterium]|nr:glycerol-3-phosphate 1-O-acyltransferase PlsY [Actinomycetota bacterium]
MTVAALVVGAYLIGSLSPSVLLGKAVRGIDIRDHGSGNAGATNAFRVLGTPLGGVVLLLDVAKGFAPVMAARFVVEPDWTVLVALAAIAGHNYSIFLRGRGGKGVATGAGVLLAMMPISLVMLLGVFAVVLLSTSFVSAASVTAAVGLPVLAFLGKQPTAYLLFSLAASGIVVWAHRGNVRRLLRGTEPKSGLTWSRVGAFLVRREWGRGETAEAQQDVPADVHRDPDEGGTS